MHGPVPQPESCSGSKAGLFAACSDAAAAHLRERVREAASAHDEPDMRLWLGLRAFFAFVAEHRREWQVLYPDGPLESGPTAAPGSGRARPWPS